MIGTKKKKHMAPQGLTDSTLALSVLSVFADETPWLKVDKVPHKAPRRLQVPELRHVGPRGIFEDKYLNDRCETIYVVACKSVWMFIHSENWGQ